MERYDRRQELNTSRRLPIVFCLDVSASMGWMIGNNSPSIELLNEAVNQFITELREDVRARSGAEVAFVTFSRDIEMETDFVSVASVTPPQFKHVDKNGTRMAQAVLRCIEKIDAHRSVLEDAEIPCYAPFLVLVTDGNPDEDEKNGMEGQALAAMRAHCAPELRASEVIVPFVIGVGDQINPETLDRYASGFSKGCFRITGQTSQARMQFSKVFSLIKSSVSSSFLAKGRGSDLIQTVQTNMDDLYRVLHGE